MIKYLTLKKDWQRIVDWVQEGLPYKPSIKTIDGAIAVEKDGEIVAATTLVNSNGVNCYAQIRVLSPHSLTKSLIEKTFYHAFVTLKLKRVSNSIIGNNLPSLMLTKKLGFQLEGMLEGITENNENIYLSVMRPEFCRYLKV
jgi:RimJ/RimL family protein N-acetyltransferase